ncbi:uroplakin-2 [Paramisgurnus dabryanus]|uniref:uroplakin-2 n=1 Tax=Paramisgurnus dabryanus TaxID=90735 RepID=UPI0031F443D8
MLAVLFIVGTLCPLNFAALDISLLNPQSDGVLTGIFSDAFLLRLPDCTSYGNKMANLLYQEFSGNQNNTKSFVVPTCNDTQSKQGYLLNNLKTGTKYSMWYNIKNDTSLPLTDTTTTVSDFRQINNGLQARSGAMVVITVILSLAMAVLLAGLIFLLAFSFH